MIRSGGGQPDTEVPVTGPVAESWQAQRRRRTQMSSTGDGRTVANIWQFEAWIMQEFSNDMLDSYHPPTGTDLHRNAGAEGLERAMSPRTER
jgi:hypothetical protein